MNSFSETSGDRPATLGALRQSGWRSRSVKHELRENLIRRLKGGTPLFPGVIGYEKTVIPQVVNAVLSRHDMILLGLRGQAKTRIARGLSDLLDEWMPVIAGSPLNEDPLKPVLQQSLDQVQKLGDELPVQWVHRSKRYQEKLATPDINMADLIGDLDPIKAAAERRSLMDPAIIQFGLIPRTNRGIFGINELPDLPTRVQVGLFNILEEKDIQIRGFPLRMPLDVQLVFTANPEDYTHRGSIVTPLRDRIRSQIHTHYPLSLSEGMAITEQESWTQRESEVRVQVPQYLAEVIEETAIQARTSSFVDQSSGVSARVTVALLENVVSNAERRGLLAGDVVSCARPTDVYAAISAVLGKIELVFEGEQEGPLSVARHLVGKAFKVVFDRRFDDPFRDGKGTDYDSILNYFRQGNVLSLSEDSANGVAHELLKKVTGLHELSRRRLQPADEHEEASAMEFVLEGLAQSSLLAKKIEPNLAKYRDQFGEMAENLKD